MTGPLLMDERHHGPDATAAVVAGCDHVDLYVRGRSVTPDAAAAVAQLAVQEC